MNAASRLVDHWWDWALAVSWQLALLVCLIAVLTYLLRGASPRLRYGLWLLVLVKALLPPTLAAFWGVGAWGLAPLAEMSWPVVMRPAESDVDADGAAARAVAVDAASDAAPVATAAAAIPMRSWLCGVWMAGCLMLWLAVALRYGRVARRTRAMRQIDEGPVRVEFERLAAQLSLGVVPELYATERAMSPLLVGVVRPKIVLPEAVLARLTAAEVRMVLAHELAHCRRRDTWTGWLQVLVQGAFWFHPLVWWANARIRQERECACDETVLREANCDRDGYGETLLRVLTATRGRSLAMANMVGVFERGSHLQTRLEEIMSFEPTKRRFGWISRAALAAAALVLLPMAAPRVEADVAPAAAGGAATNDDVQPARPATNWPVIVKCQPTIGATDVDPNLREIAVTFDRDMNVGGYSWTGGGEFFPPSPEGKSAVWIDKRTCILPVDLKRGSFYRVGINSSSHRNFKSALGVPAETVAIYFVTKDANRAVANRVRVPKVVKLVPANGATDVDPATKAIRVTFDMPMDVESYSFTGGGPSFPGAKDAPPRWSSDGKSCVLPVALEPGREYELGLNSVSHKNFTSKWGVPLKPVRYTFRTSGGK